jgi:tetratricopeptide (TPR) repeat protein
LPTLVSAIITAAGIADTAAAQPVAPPAPRKAVCTDISGWAPGRPQTVVPSFKSPHITDDCFSALIASLVAADKKTLSDSMTPVFSTRARKNRFTLELLFSLYRIKPLSGDAALWGKVVDIWAAASPQTPDAILAESGEGVRIPVADTLYRALDAAGRLDAQGLLRHGRVKCLMGDYRGAAAVYCRAAADRRLEHIAVTQMEQLFADADSSVRLSAIRDFRACALSLPAADTAFYRNRLADFYGRHGHFDEEISILAALNTRSAPTGRKLAETARAHFSARRYRLAAAAASAAYGRLEDGDQTRASAAFTAYRAYAQIKARDSALVWLRLSGATDRDAKILAVALNQETGRLEEAARLLEQLPPSLSKDTLAVRAYIFSGEIGKALNHIATATTPSWVMSPRERMLWRARCLIFHGQPYDAAPTLDSLKFMPSWNAASETLRYKYWLQKLDEGGVPQGAAQLWGRLEYCVYTGDLNAAVKGLKGFFDAAGIQAPGAGGAGEALAVRLAGALSENFKYAEALEVLEMAGGGGGGRVRNPNLNLNLDINFNIDGGRSPEYLFVKAEALIGLGRNDQARDIAQKILSEYPGDVFAQRARMLLVK